MCWTPVLVESHHTAWVLEIKAKGGVVVTRMIQSNILLELLADHCKMSIFLHEH